MMPVRPTVYLDNQATTRPDPRVVDAMVPHLRDRFGNAASKSHRFGLEAEAAVEGARKEIAELCGADPKEIVFTSGATESINLALKGIVSARGGRPRHVITTAVEHRAVLDTCRELERLGCRLTVLPVDEHGLISLANLEKAMSSDTVLVSVIAANNEIGSIAAVEDIGRVCRQHGILFHTDATQAVGKIPFNVAQMDVDLMSCSAHKMYGPKGTGILYVRSSLPFSALVPQVHGGGHERGLRSGTPNVPAIAGFGMAARIAANEMNSDRLRIERLRDRLEATLKANVEHIRVNGHPARRLPNNLSVTFSGISADTVMMDVRDVAVSSGAACSSASTEPSHVLKAIGLNRSDARATIRFGLGKDTTQEDIDYAADRFAHAVKMHREKTGFAVHA